MVAKYRCMNKECKHYYWSQHFVPPSMHYGDYIVEDEDKCATCQSVCQKIEEEKSELDNLRF